MKIFIKITSLFASVLLFAATICAVIPAGEKSAIDVVLSFLSVNIIWLVALWVIIILVTVGQLVTLVRDIKLTNVRHKFSLGSRPFNRFFKKWYSREGTLRIICDDLQWVNDGIMDALKKKSTERKLHLYIKEKCNDENTKILEGIGATTHDIPNQMPESFTLSCISIMGNTLGIIIRNKTEDTHDKIIMEEIVNPYLSGLLNSFFEEDNKNEFQR